MNDSAKLPPHLSAHSDTLENSALSPLQSAPSPEEPLALVLKGKDGQEVNLTSSQLESWFASIEQDNIEANANSSLAPNLPLQEMQRDPYFATQFVGRYGMKSAKDVIAFLKSPAGDSVNVMIAEELAQVAALDKFKEQQYHDHEVRKHQLLAFLLLGMLYKEAHARHVVEVNSQQAEARVQQGEANIAQEQQKAKEQKLAELSQTHSSFTNSALAIQSQLNQKEQELSKVQHELQSMDPEEIQQRYATLENHLQELDVHLQLPGTSIDAEIVQLELERTQLEMQLRALDQGSENNLLVDPNAPQPGVDLQDKIAALSARLAELKQQKATQANEHIPKIETKIAELSQRLDDHLQKIEQLIKDGEDEKALAMLSENQGLHLQIAGLKDMMAVLKGEKILYKENGELAKSFDEAAFILPSDKKVVKREDKFYLIGANQDLDSMSQLEIQQAQEAFQKARPEISSLKQLVQHNHNLENERLENAQEKSKSLHNDIMMLRNQLNHIQAARAQVVDEMRKLDPNRTPGIPHPSIPTPTPSNSGSSVDKQTLQSQNIQTTQVYKMLHTIIQQLPRNNPKEAADQLEKEIERHYKAKGQTMSEAAKALLKTVIDPIRTGMTPIPKIPMDTLIRCMPYFGVEQEKGNVMSPTPTSQANKPESPTPLSTTFKM